MPAFFHLLVMFVVNPFRSRRRLEIENLFLRHQLNIALRRAPHRLRLRTSDRTLLILMTWLWPSLIGLCRIVQPETILRWHRAGFRTYWRWKSRGRPGRPKIERELRELIRRMSQENRLWGAPRIHGELLKLGFEVAESTVSKYMAKRRGPPSQGWRTFLRNHADVIAAIDLCLVPTVKFECLFAFRDALSQALRRATGSSRRHDARRDLKLPRPLYLVVRLRSGRSKRTYDLTSSIVPRGTASIRSRHKAGRPCCCIWRTPSSRSSSIVRELLQSSSNALIAEQGCAGNPFHRNRWPHSGRANPGRIAP